MIPPLPTINIPELAAMPHGGSIACYEPGILMSEIRRRYLLNVFAAAIAILMAAVPVHVVAAEFPFDREMLLDVKPLPGSKRVPILEIGADGRAQVDFWCKSGMAQVGVTGETIRFALGRLREEGCTPERIERDDAMIAAFSQAMQWRIEDDVVILTGPVELRFRLSTP
jgi:heat shock protein HslJ